MHWAHQVSSRSSTGLIAGLLVAAALVALAGCEHDGKVPVTGTVTFNGAEVPDGHIIFTPVDPSIRPDADKIKDGQFSFRATAGEKRVEIFADRVVGEPDPTMGTVMKEQYIPVRYNEQTELTADVTDGGENRFQFDLVEQEGDRKAGDLSDGAGASP